MGVMGDKHTPPPPSVHGFPLLPQTQAVYKLYANVFTLYFISVGATRLSGPISTCQPLEQTSVASGNISDKQTRCYDMLPPSPPPTLEKGVGRRAWSKATGRSVFPG